MNAPPRPDPRIPQRRATVPDSSVWVSASAGTGKTKVLTDRVLSLLLSGTSPSRILCLTFTRAAAAEMSNRVNDALGEWAAVDEKKLLEQLEDLLGHAPDGETCNLARQLFARVLDVPGGMKIQTIHAFCESLLARFPLEAGLAPHFELMDERSSAEALLAARDRVLSLARDDESGELAAALDEVVGWVGEYDFAALLETLASSRQKLRRLIGHHGTGAKLDRAIHGAVGAATGDSDEDIAAAACADAAFDGEGLKAACKALAEGSEADQRRGDAIADWLASKPKVRAEGFDDYVTVFLTQAATPRRTLITKPAAENAPGASDDLRAEAERLVEVHAKRNALTTARATAALARLGAGLLDQYEAHKAARGLLDYDDLIQRARALLEAGDAVSWVLYKLDGGIDHILIDEAQDTSPDQWAVVRALAGEFFAGAGARDVTRTVFAVGDPKQSIYSFQGADPAQFDAMRRHFTARVEAAAQSWDDVDIDISFRSAPAVLQTVDEVFAAEAARDGVAMGHDIRHVPYREGHAGLVELWPPVTPLDEPERKPWQLPLEMRGGETPAARLARVIAYRVRGWIDDGEMLESKGRPIRAGDIMVLVRSRTAFVDHLVGALKRREVPVAGVDRMVLSGQLAVMDLIALGRFLLLPQDDLTLAVVLKGPLFGLGEEALFDLAYGRGDATLWSELQRRATDSPAFAAAADELSALLARADYVPPFELFVDVLGRRGGRRKALSRLGFEAADPIDEFLAQALAFERLHTPTLQGFLHWIDAGAAEIKRDLEQAARDEVRVMTVHGAKGLQAPIVFLPDTMSAPRTVPRLLWRNDGIMLWPPRRAFVEPLSEALREAAARDRDREYRRLLYVAMTRAEDRLYVCGWQTRNKPPEHCWYRLVEKGLGAVTDSVAFDFTVKGAEGWRGEGMRLDNPQEVKPDEEEEGEPYVTAADLPGWATAPAPAEDVPPRPLAPSRPEDDEPATVSPIGADKGARFRRGNLIHGLLQTLPDLPPGERAGAARDFLARKGHGVSGTAQKAILAETLAVLDDPGFGALFAPGSRAEVPVMGCIGGRVISGQVDRLVVADGTVQIVDYKSNRPPPAEAAEVAPLYLRQMAAYRAVLREIYPDFTVSCALLWTVGPNLMGLDDGVLDRYAP